MGEGPSCEEKIAGIRSHDACFSGLGDVIVWELPEPDFGFPLQFADLVRGASAYCRNLVLLLKRCQSWAAAVEEEPHQPTWTWLDLVLIAMALASFAALLI